MVDLDDDGIRFTARTLFERLSPFYDDVLDYATLLQDRYWKRWLLNELRLREEWVVLDLGCGTCVLEEHLCEIGCDVVGVDLTEEMLRVGIAKRLPCTDSLLVGDAEKMPVRERVFDAVVSCYVAKYCDLDAFVSEVGRSLKPGGRIALYDFSSPQGFFAVFHAFYLYGVLRLIGSVLGRTRPGLAFTFKNLPAIVSVRRWDQRLEEKLAKHGFSAIKKKKLSGGVVTAFSATLTS
jgi:demethylmenaquinone methyltransferase/2-methoxy-6-polyprenyl-1,4-benzoquinol methylase